MTQGISGESANIYGDEQGTSLRLQWGGRGWVGEYSLVSHIKRDQDQGETKVALALGRKFKGHQKTQQSV